MNVNSVFFEKKRTNFEFEWFDIQDEKTNCV